MQSRLRKLKGFTLVELLVVLVIIAILAAVAAPIYFANTERAKASEGVSAMSSIRQAMRDFLAGGGTNYFSIASPNIKVPLPSTVSATGVTTPAGSGVGIDVGTPQYFSNAAFTVVSAVDPAFVAAGTSGMFTAPPAQGFTILVNGNSSVLCAGAALTDCAVKQGDVAGGAGKTYCLEMDNSGRTFVNYTASTTCTGGTWSSY